MLRGHQGRTTLKKIYIIYIEVLPLMTIHKCMMSNASHLENEIILEMLNNKGLKAVRSSEGTTWKKILFCIKKEGFSFEDCGNAGGLVGFSLLFHQNLSNKSQL